MATVLLDAQDRSTPAAAAGTAGVSAPLVCFPFAGGTVGGSHISAVKLIQALDPAQFRPLVVLHRAEGQLPEFLRSEGLPFELLPVPHFLGNSWGIDRQWNAAEAIRGVAAQPGLARFLRERRVSIVHSNDGAMHLTWSLPARAAGAAQLWHHRGGPDARGLRLLAPFAADRIAAVSSFALSGSGTRARAKARVIYSPFDSDQPIPDRRAAHCALTQELGLPERTRLIGFFGNIDDRKRPLAFVDMLAELRRIAPDLPFAGLMFGATLDPDLEAAVHERAERHALGNRFAFMGFRRPATPLLAGCDVHAVTAVQEPYGRSLIEAMLLGTPVVAAASGGNIEAIHDSVTGCLVPPDNPAAMAHAVAALLADPQLNSAIASAARTHAVESFGVARHAGQVADLYRSMLVERQRL